MLTIEIRTTDIMGAGRPTEYRPEYAEDTRKLCLLGFTDAQLADFFDVSEATINNWKLAHPDPSLPLRVWLGRPLLRIKIRQQFNVEKVLIKSGYSASGV